MSLRINSYMYVKRINHFTGKNWLLSSRWVSMKFQNLWQWEIYCWMLVLWYHLDNGFFSRVAEKEPVSDYSHHNIKANIMKTIFHLQIRAEWNSKPLLFGTFTLFSFLNEVPNIRETYLFFSVDTFFKMELFKLENISDGPAYHLIGHARKAWNLIEFCQIHQWYTYNTHTHLFWFLSCALVVVPVLRDTIC